MAHASWGEGVVRRYDDHLVVALFDDQGYKTLALDIVEERPILTSVDG